VAEVTAALKDAWPVPKTVDAPAVVVDVVAGEIVRSAAPLLDAKVPVGSR
jgi:hypothetical protein